MFISERAELLNKTNPSSILIVRRFPTFLVANLATLFQRNRSFQGLKVFLGRLRNISGGKLDYGFGRIFSRFELNLFGFDLEFSGLNNLSLDVLTLKFEKNKEIL